MKNLYKLSHVVLYAKDFYVKSEDVWKDLISILEIEGYTVCSKKDVYEIIINSIEKKEFDYRFNDLREVLRNITPEECWKFGYYTKEHTWADIDNKPDYDMQTAFIFYVLCNLRMLETKYWIVKLPNYTKHPKNQRVKDSDLENLRARIN